MEVPYAAGSLSYLMGAHLYKRAAFEGYALHRRTKGKMSAVLKWARVEVTGVHGPSLTLHALLCHLLVLRQCASDQTRQMNVLCRDCYGCAGLRAWLLI